MSTRTTAAGGFSEGTAATTKKYIVKTIIVRGLRRSTMAINKYSVEFSLNGRTQWKTREVSLIDEKATWETADDRHEIECAPDEILSLVVYWKHYRVDEVGRAERSVQKWTTQRYALLSAKPDERTMVQLLLEERNMPDEAGPISAAIDRAEMDAAAAWEHQGPNFAIIDGAIGSKNRLEDIGSAWEPLMENLQVFANLMSVASEVHPYVKIATSVLLPVYQAVKTQRQRDKDVRELVDTLEGVYSALCDANRLRKYLDKKASEGTLFRLAQQTVDCAYFISGCTKEKGFWKRLVSQGLRGVEARIKEYKDKFSSLQQELVLGSQVRTEATTTLVAEKVKDLAITLHLDRIPYAPGAGHQPSKHCLENTRTALLEEISTWASQDDDKERLFVLLGAAGTGKSTVAHTVAGRFRKLDRLGACFCFSSSASATRKPVSLFRNIAHELANAYEHFSKALQDAVRGNPSLCTTEDIEQQFETFILKPSQHEDFVINGTILVMIDAFDECGTIAERRQLLNVLRQRLHETPPAFRFLLTSRGEADIRRAFPSCTQNTIVKWMPTLQNDDKLSEDVHAYVRHTLSENGLLCSGLSEESCKSLVYKAEGVFQWAFLACRYIMDGRPGETPLRRYELLNRDAGTGLDNLYLTVLRQVVYPKHTAHHYDDEEQGRRAIEFFKNIMGFVMTAVEPLSIQSLATLISYVCDASLPDAVSSEVSDWFRSLGSLLNGVDSMTDPIKPVHSSFIDLLRDPRRGGAFYVDLSGHHEKLALASLQLLRYRLQFNIGKLETSYKLNDIALTSALRKALVSDELQYACKYWGRHLVEASERYISRPSDLKHLVRQLLQEKFLFWVDAASVAGVVAEATSSLELACGYLTVTDPDTVAVARDALRFLRTFAQPIVQCAAHVYLSALLWTPRGSLLAGTYSQLYPQSAQLMTGSAMAWTQHILTVAAHRDRVHCVAVSADGKLLASSSRDKTIRMWNANTSEPVGHIMRDHKAEVNVVAFSPSGRFLASGSSDKTVRLWTTATCEPAGTPIEHEADVLSVAFSSDDRVLASAARDGTIRIWTATGDTWTLAGPPLMGHQNAVLSVAFSADGVKLASGSRDRTVRLWDTRRYEQIGPPLTAHKSSVHAVKFSPSGSLLASASGDKTIRLWDAQGYAGLALRPALRGHTDVVNAISFSRDGRRLASGSDDGTIRIWDIESRQSVGEPLKGHKGPVTSVEFSPDSGRLSSGSADKTVQIWSADVEQMNAESTIGHEEWVSSVAFSPDGRIIVSGSSDRTTRLWDAEGGHPIGEPRVDHLNQVTCVAFSPSGHRVMSGSWDRTVRIWDLNDRGRAPVILKGHTGAVHCAVFSPRGDLIATASDDKTLRVWNTATQDSISTLSGHTKTVRAVAFSRDGRRVASGSDDGSVRLWDARKGAPLKSFDGHQRAVRSVAFSPNGRWLASAGQDNTIRVWDAQTGQSLGEPLKGHKNWVYSVAFSPNSRWMVSGSLDKTIRVWNAYTRKPVGEPLMGHHAAVLSVAFSPDSERVVSGSADKTIRIWRPVLEGVRVGVVNPVRADTTWSDPGSGLGHADSRPHSPISSTFPRQPPMTPQRSQSIGPRFGLGQYTFSPDGSPVATNPPWSGWSNPLSEDGTFSLSPNPEHRLKQPYQSDTGEPTRFTIDADTGWIKANEKDHILWVPPDQLPRLYAGLQEVIIPGPTIHVDLSKFVHGTRWTECYQQ